MYKKIFTTLLLTIFLTNQSILVLAYETKFPNYSYEFLGHDNYEKFNRKLFNFNLKLNKYALRPIHIVWSSIMPVYGMDRLHGISKNIEYPIRLMSCLIQRDFKSAKNETIRFLTNTTLGIGGMFDPAKRLFNLEQVNEDMEQALAGCKIKSGKFIVLPILSFISPLGIVGKILDMAFNPSSYVASPVLAIVKAGLTLNRSTYLQPWISLVESTFADPYDIAKMIYGIDRHIKCNNFDRVNIKDCLVTKNIDKTQKDEEKIVNQNLVKPVQDNLVNVEVSSEIVIPELLKGGAIIDKTLNGTENFKLKPDIVLKDYNPQSPVTDSMRTALFDNPKVSKSIWNEFSIWNNSFAQKIKTSSVKVYDGREDYKFRYILQKTKTSPLAIIYPSIGEGIYSDHSVLFADIFYKMGYSVIIQGSHFQWEFLRSMEPTYKPGSARDDAKQLRLVTTKIIDKLEKEKGKEFGKKVFLGTSFGAFQALFVANLEYVDNTLGDSKFIAICPPVELFYAMKQVDKIANDLQQKQKDSLKDDVSQTAAKVVKLFNEKDSKKNLDVASLPFNDDESKTITTFVMHQKLSDLLHTISVEQKDSEDIYNVNFEDYANKYLIKHSEEKFKDFSYEISLHSISDYLELNDNYKIYHSVNDYLTNTNQLKKLKQYSKDKTILFDNGAHLGFMYRDEFLDSLKSTIESFK